MTAQGDALFYRFAPGIDVVPVGDGNIVFKSDTLAVRLEGRSAVFFAEHVLPLLDGQHSLSDIAAGLPGIAIADLRKYLDALVGAQVLRVGESPHRLAHPHEQALRPFLELLELLGVPPSLALEKLGNSCVAIFGLEGHGAELAVLLARSGVGGLVLADPFPCHAENLLLMPLLGPDAVGKSRQEALQAALEAQSTGVRIRMGPEHELTRDSIASLAPQCKVLVNCYDRGFSSVHQWVNQASLASGVPAIYAEVRAHLGLVGPLILPGQTACYMCYRMRNIACADDFNVAMSYEEAMDRQKRPALHERGVLPMLLTCIASIAALEILKHLLSLPVPSLAGAVLEFDALELQTSRHEVLQEPACPVCGEKKKNSRQHPLIAELLQTEDAPGQPASIASKLVSARAGIVKDFGRVEKDPSEPALPYVYYAELANSGFADKGAGQKPAASGKGMTVEAARSSALGEAVERYSGARWDPSEIVYARRTDLEGKTLDPRRMVLYAQEQYPDLPYAPYSDEMTIGWVQARSLVSGQGIWVPAITVFMGYQTPLEPQRICAITSNGLAAGPSLPDAILKATFEVLERDAFMLTWLNRLPCRRVSIWDLPQTDVVELCEAYRRRRVDIQLYLLATDHPCHVFTALGVQTENVDGPAIVVGLGADLDPIRAARQAILEVAQARPALRQLMRHPETQKRMEELSANPHLVASLDDHALLYADGKMCNAFDFMLSNHQYPFIWQTRPPERSASKLRLLVDFFFGKGWDLIYYNLTPPDMKRLGLYTARAIVPDCQPIDFGWKERRLGGERLYEFPRQVGLSARRITRTELNDWPQPLA